MTTRRQISGKGGNARAQKLSPARRSQIARKAANARWAKPDRKPRGKHVMWLKTSVPLGDFGHPYGVPWAFALPGWVNVKDFPSLKPFCVKRKPRGPHA